MFEIFQYDFMVRAFIAGIMLSVIAPVIGTFLVVRRYSLLADTLAHVSLFGVAVGLMTRLNPLITAVIASVVAATGMERIRLSKRVSAESVLALFLSGSLAAAVVLMSATRGLNANVFQYLFGSITTVSWQDILIIAICGAVVFVTVFILYKEFFFISLDEELAMADGLSTKSLNAILLVLAAVTVALSLRVVGVLLVGALMVIPVLTAIQFGRGFRATAGFAILFSVIAVVVGLILSYYFNVASGGAIVLTALTSFLLVIFFVGKQSTFAST